MSEEQRVQKDENRFADSVGRPVTRREFLKGAGIAGATLGAGAGLGGLLAACGGGATTTTAAQTTVSSAATTTTGSPSTTAGATTTASTGAEVGEKVAIGFVQPVTGPLAAAAAALDYIVARWKEHIGDGLVLGDGKKHLISIEVADSQSDTNRAAQVAGDLINNTKVDIMMTSFSPDVVTPVVEQCESFGVPVVSTSCPWQAYLGPHSEYKWSYHFSFGVEDLLNIKVSAFNAVSNNKVLGIMLDNSADGVVFSQLEPPFMKSKGYTVNFPAPYQPGTEDYTAPIAAFKKAGVELISGVMIPPDFTNFWKSAIQQGLTTIKACVIGKALLFPQAVEALGPIGDGLLSDIWWHPTYPFKSSLSGETCQELADDYEAKTGKQQTASLNSYCLGEMALSALAEATDPKSRDSILVALETLKVETISGHIDFTEAVMERTGTGPLDFKTGPGRKTKNVYGSGQAIGQWVAQGGKWPFDIVPIEKFAAPFIPDSAIKPVKPLAAMKA